MVTVDPGAGLEGEGAVAAVDGSSCTRCFGNSAGATGSGAGSGLGFALREEPLSEDFRWIQPSR